MSNPMPDSDIDAAMPEISGYRLSRVIGHGGMSTVYLGEQASLEREVAIKVMLPEALADEVSRRRFENEARTIARLEHPHIVGIFEIGRTRDGLPYYAMPFLAHGHLGQRDFTQDGLDNAHARVRAILYSLLTALDYAHQRGVVHRDVKAENVLFDEAERPLLADFGIALRRFGPRVTTAGMAVGSTAYMAPEQARGEEVDARADLYSVGVLAWEMLTGQLPYMAGDALSMAVMHAQDPIPRLPRSLRHWQRFLDKALAKSPAQRYRSARQMREALDRVPRRSGQPLVMAREKLRYGIEQVRRWPKTAWLIVVLAIAAATGLVLRQAEQVPGSSFFRAPGASRDLPQPGEPTGMAVTATDPGTQMLRPLPISPAERWVVAAEQQLRQQNLTAPADANAYDSLVAAWKVDPGHPRLAADIGQLLDALGAQADRNLRAGNDRRARDYLQHATQFAAQTRQGDSASMAKLRAGVVSALDDRIGDAEKKFNRASALAAVETARELGVAPTTIAGFATRAQRIPTAGDKLPGDEHMRLVRVGDKVIAAAAADVSRADYARFAFATGRPAALCRERTSLLRLLAPRSWKEPGFAQSAAHPVVCVSWSDAAAYANWIAQRSGHHYRLPTDAEARVLPNAGAATPVATWLEECTAGCRQRLSTGRSWRGTSGTRPLDPSRGYDDVGFRLVRDQ
ncbi:bifunctional serine/threonine-protein kinase/formylglycine-generating enzyme family protein [Cognatiluteimonas profundi]|uniref:bifunctional serine/threonine-protein kinase/formylglycine-generating enzyme family protein n=1 Tax=Cognatiluteimonas profundi TaxID=2594501 RepID=UPI00131D83D5|nr:bifunctional serine/threonine-protein kinase/formylglycine-generating enzyme family protein [Lysobacter profundi]